MTTDERQELIDRLRTFAAAIEDGVPIQQFVCGRLVDRKDEWLMGILSELRTVRTNSKPPIERWLVVLKGIAGTATYDNKDEAGRYAKQMRHEVERVVHLREVTQ